MDIGPRHVPHELLWYTFSFLNTEDIKHTPSLQDVRRGSLSLLDSFCMDISPGTFVRNVYDTSYYEARFAGDADTIGLYSFSLDAGSFDWKRCQKPTSKYI